MNFTYLIYKIYIIKIDVKYGAYVFMFICLCMYVYVYVCSIL